MGPKRQVCVCVCPTLDKGSYPTTLPILHRQGGNARLTDIAQRRRCQLVVKQCGTPHCVPAEVFSTSCHPTFPRFDSWFFMILPQNLPFAAFVLQLGRADRSFSRLDQQLVETPTSLSDFSPCRSIAFFPIETIALTENPSSKCVLLSRPTRVLSVIPVTGAPFLHGKATTPTHHRSLELHRKAPTPSQNQPPHRPPGQKTVLEKSLRFRTSDFRFRHSAFFSWFPIMCALLCSLCCCRDSFIDSTQGRALQLFSLIRDA